MMAPTITYENGAHVVTCAECGWLRYAPMLVDARKQQAGHKCRVARGGGRR